MPASENTEPGKYPINLKCPGLENFRTSKININYKVMKPVRAYR
jgi:hypothetical protein